MDKWSLYRRENSWPIKIGLYWAIPEDVIKPADEKNKSGRYIKKQAILRSIGLLKGFYSMEISIGKFTQHSFGIRTSLWFVSVQRLLWEFVGGKVEPGKTKEQALIRECQEELAVILDVGDVFMDVIHEYLDLTVDLTLFNVSIQSGTPQKLENNDIRWITVDKIDQYDFCPADEEILMRLKTIKKRKAPWLL